MSGAGGNIKTVISRDTDNLPYKKLVHDCLKISYAILQKRQLGLLSLVYLDITLEYL